MHPRVVGAVAAAILAAVEGAHPAARIRAMACKGGAAGLEARRWSWTFYVIELYRKLYLELLELDANCLNLSTFR